MLRSGQLCFLIDVHDSISKLEESSRRQRLRKEVSEIISLPTTHKALLFYRLLQARV